MERRVNKEIAALDRMISFLERSADACWEYPNAENNNETYLSVISEREAEKELISTLVESISKSKQILQQIKESSKELIL